MKILKKVLKSTQIVSRRGGVLTALGEDASGVGENILTQSGEHVAQINARIGRSLKVDRS